MIYVSGGFGKKKKINKKDVPSGVDELYLHAVQLVVAGLLFLEAWCSSQMSYRIYGTRKLTTYGYLNMIQFT